MIKLRFLTVSFLIGVCISLQAQVGINTTNPESTLDIVASNSSNPTAEDGILIPRIEDFPTTNPGAGQDGMLVFLNTNSGSDPRGFYFWDNLNNEWVGFGAGGWNIDGNADINDASNFLGTTSQQSIVFRTNNLKIGELDHTGAISFGFGTNNTPANSIAIGTNAATPSVESIAIGLNSRSDQQGAIAIGNSARANNTDGIAIGGQSDSQSQRTIAIGNGSFSQNVDAISMGSNARAVNQNSISIGRNASTQGLAGISVGEQASANSQNTIAIGPGSFAQNNDAMALGSRARSQHQNSIALGSNAQTTSSNQLRLGNINQFDLNGASIMNASDQRFKYEVQENIPGLSFITRLRPVSYKFDYKKLDEFTNSEHTRTNSNIIESGLIAQEIEAAMVATGYDFDGLKKPKNENDDIYKVSYVKLIVPLIQAVKEQQNQITLLQKQISQLETLKNKLDALQAIISTESVLASSKEALSTGK